MSGGDSGTGGGGEAAPAFSVVIPVFNGSGYLARAIESALAQELPPLEVIVVDDGSTDGSAGVADSFGPPVRCVRQENAGPAAARNRGVAVSAAASGWVAFLDHDDLWEPGYLREAASYLAGHPAAGVVCFGARVLAEGGEPTPHILLKRTPGAVYSTRGMLEGDVGTIMTPVVRKDLFLSVSGFDPALRGGEDCDLWLRLSLVTEIHQVRLPLLLYRKHETNTSWNVLMTAEHSLLSLEKLGREHPQFLGEHGEAFRKMRGKQYLRLGRELLYREHASPESVRRARAALAAAVADRPDLWRARFYSFVALLPGGAAAFARWRRRELALRGWQTESRAAAFFRHLRRRRRGTSA